MTDIAFCQRLFKQDSIHGDLYFKKHGKQWRFLLFLSVPQSFYQQLGF